MTENKIMQQTPNNTQIIAHETDAKEIESIFKTTPWCHFIQTRAGILSRERWAKARQEKGDK